MVLLLSTVCERERERERVSELLEVAMIKDKDKAGE